MTRENIDNEGRDGTFTAKFATEMAEELFNLGLSRIDDPLTGYLIIAGTYFNFYVQTYLGDDENLFKSVDKDALVWFKDAQRWLELAEEERRQSLNKQEFKDSVEIKKMAIWEKIPKNNNDQEIIKLWCEGFTNSEIGEKISMSPNTITKRISELRRYYPQAGIPYDRERRKSS